MINSTSVITGNEGYNSLSLILWTLSHIEFWFRMLGGFFGFIHSEAIRRDNGKSTHILPFYFIL